MKACPACGRLNDPTRKFCGGCGSSLADGPPPIPSVREGSPMAPQLVPGSVPGGRALGSSVKLGLMLILLTAGLVGLGSLFGPGGAAVFLVLAVLLNVGSYWYSDRLVIFATGAKEVSREQAPQLHEIVETLASRAGVPKPKVFLMESPAPNAFATGRSPKRAVVAVTRGLLNVLDRHELEGVLGHELGHVLNRDILVSSIVACLCGAIMFLATAARWGAIMAADDERVDGLAWLVIGFLAPIGAMLVQLGISRSREYRADVTGARLSGKPLALASALQRIESASHLAHPLRVSPQAAHLFLVPPLPKGWIATLFSTHPDTAERVKRLKAMVKSA
ncbi:MAG TPA: M48 family metalloprotease [Planctomycetota bacterium]|nr:M48 family metalloprotease [Planctomycetota bacterium]